MSQYQQHGQSLRTADTKRNGDFLISSKGVEMTKDDTDSTNINVLNSHILKSNAHVNSEGFETASTMAKLRRNILVDNTDV